MDKKDCVITFRTTQEISDKLHKYVQDENRSLSYLVEQAVIEKYKS